MENTSRMPSTSSAADRQKGNPRGLGTGAITSPMAVSFREEKLALGTNGLTSSNLPDITLSAFAEGGRG